MADPQWWPLDSVVVTGAWANSPAYYAQFGQLGHNGIDLQAAIGTPVYATDDGVIHMEGWNISWSGTAGGIAAIIRHAWGYSGYAHLSSTIINAGQQVTRGQLIGYSGNTGVGTGPHLHFETFPPNVNFANGFSGRVNPASIINLQARGSSVPIAKPTKGLPMYAPYWTGPTVNNTKVSGRIITDYGSFGVPNMQIMNLLVRRYNASFKQDAENDNMLDAEHDILNSYLQACFHSAQAGVKLEADLFIKAINEGFSSLGKNITVTAESVDVNPEDLLAALELAVPRIADAMVRQAGERLSQENRG